MQFRNNLFAAVWLALATGSLATILQNGQVRPTDYPDTSVTPGEKCLKQWTTFPPDASELSYKGRWDDKHISWWSSPGLKFGFQSNNVFLSFGPYTSEGVLIAYRLDGQDWMLTNVTANSTHHLISPKTPGFNLSTSETSTRTFEMRVTNWAYGVQIKSVHLSGGDTELVKMPDYTRRIEVIGDSLSSGYTATLEGISNYAWGLVYGLGNTEFSITAYPGICVTDALCFGNKRGLSYQWKKTSDTSPRAEQLYGDDPPDWDFSKQTDPEIVVINIGTNDNNTANNVAADSYYNAYIDLIEQVHETWPDAQIIVQSLWSGWYRVGSSWTQSSGFYEEIQGVVKHFNNGSLNKKGGEGFVYYYNTTGIMQHNDNNPAYHPTDVGHVKVASHLMEYIRIIFDWELMQLGPEVQRETLYWNNEQSY